MLTEAKIIPCQNCKNLHKDFKLPINFKSIHQVKTITVIEGSDTNLNELEVPNESNKSNDNDDIVVGSDNETQISSSNENNEDHRILKRSIRRMNNTRKLTAEPLISWREYDQVKQPIKREISTNANSTKVKKRRIKIRPLEANVGVNSTLEKEKRKATEILEAIKTTISDQSLKNVTTNKLQTAKEQDLNGTEAQHKILMTQALIRKPNGKQILLQDKAFSEPIRKNIKIDNYDKLDRAFKTNVNFYDDLPNYSKQYNSPSNYDRDSSSYYYERPSGSSYYEPKDTFKYSQEDDAFPSYKPHNHDSYDVPFKYKSPNVGYDAQYDKHNFDNTHDDYDSYSKNKPYHQSHHKYKSKKPVVDTMVDVMPDHDAQYEYVPMEKDEYGNGKIKQHYPSFKHEKYKSGYDSGEDEQSGGGYGYSSLPQKSYYSKNKPYDYYSRPLNNFNSHDNDRPSYKPKYRDETYPKYEKVPREYDYETHGDGSEESRTHHSRTKYGIKNSEKPLTLKVNLDENENEEGRDYDYASRDGTAGRIAARVTKVPKTLEEYHRLHRTWEKRPVKSKKTYSDGDDDDHLPKNNRKPIRPKAKQSPRPFPPSRGSLEKPQVSSSYEFERPNAHVSMDFDTTRTPHYDEHSEAFQDTSAESDESDETISRPSPIKISPEIDSVFNKFNEKESFKRITTERPYKITRLAGKPLYSEENDSEESNRNILKDIKPKLSQRDREDLYDKLKNEVGHKKYKSSVKGSTPRDDIFKELGLDFDEHSNKGSYRPDKSRIITPKVGSSDDEFKDSGPRKSWSFQYP